jgi:anti-sigma regulatory factor (Ser/Thr protein kinase)
VTTVAETLWAEVERRADHDLLRLHGELSLATSARVRTLIGTSLGDRGAVVVDLADLRVRWASATEVFSSALAAAGGWPTARLVLTGAAPELARRLRSVRVSSTVPVVDDLAAAVGRLRERPERVARHRELQADPGAPAAARTLVREACQDWDVTASEDAAALVVSELVTNAVQHARTSCRVTVGIGPDGLHIGVRDYAPGPAPRPRPVDTGRAGGRGLHLVAMLAIASGVASHPDGKTAWAVIAVPRGVNSTR